MVGYLPKTLWFACLIYYIRLQYSIVPGTLYCKKHRPSDETLNRGSDSLWPLKIPGCPSKKSRGVTPASWPNFPIGLWPSWPPNHPHTLIGFVTLSLLVILLLQWLSKPLGSTVWSLLQWLSKPLWRAVCSLLQLLSQPLGGATCCELFRTLYCSSS